MCIVMMKYSIGHRYVMTKVKMDNTIDIDIERKNSLRHDVDVALFSVGTSADEISTQFTQRVPR